MATRKPKRSSLEDLVKREALKTQRLQAKFEAAQLKAALAYYAAADKGRRNKDWNAAPASADLAIIPDAPTTNARARHSIANTWIGKAGKRAQVRNVVGRGIEVVPTPRDANGNETEGLGEAIAKAWSRWACAFNFCDAEQRRTFYQFQRSLVSEEFATGIGLLVWSYEPNQYVVGLRLQLFEYEQLDTRIFQYGENEVRGGVEVDENGAAIAYHFFKKNPSDYLRPNMQSVRVEAMRVLAFFDPERVRQTIGISHLAAVLPDVRNFARSQDSFLWRHYMESCIGFAIKKTTPTIGNNPLTLARAAGDTGTTPSGMRTFDMVPGMVPELMPGEEIQPFIPSTPGDGYEVFTDTTLRGIGAGIGLSKGALTRYSEGNYSSARQDMLEDEREIGPQQDALIDHIIKPIYELWLSFAVMESRVPISQTDFLAKRDDLWEADYIPPARPWIDPEKEMNAAKTGIDYLLTTRSAIWAQRGGRYAAGIKQIARERKEAKALSISLPEENLQKAPQQPVDAGNAAGTQEAQFAKETKPSALKLAVVSDAPPNYRPTIDAAIACVACKYFDQGTCAAYSKMKIGGAFVCDSFEVSPPTQDDTKRNALPPPAIDGGIDRGVSREGT